LQARALLIRMSRASINIQHAISTSFFPISLFSLLGLEFWVLVMIQGGSQSHI